MKVKSLISNRKLIKDYIYETDFFCNDPTISQQNANYWRIGHIFIIDRGYYSCKDFTTTDGNPIPEILFDERSKNEPFDISDLRKGDIVTCKSEAFKFLIKGGKYRIEEVRIERQRYYDRASIKLEGYKRWLVWNTYNFRKLSLQESRDLVLSQIFDQIENFSVDFKRKFEQSKTQEKVLIETLAKSILDKYRHKLDIIDWGIEKNGAIFSMTREDFEPLMDKPLREILEIYENFSNE